MKRGMRRVTVGVLPTFVLAILSLTLLGGGPAGASSIAISVMLDEDPPVVDDFNRPDEQPLSDGGKWSLLGGGYQLKVVSNQLACSASSTCRYWRNDVRYGLDQDVMVTVAAKPGHNNWLRLYVRLQQPTIFDGYALRYQDNTSGSDQVILERVTGGGFTTLATFGDELFPGDKLRLRAIGPTLEAWRSSGGSWTLIGSASDSTYVGVGYVAVEIRYPNARLDDFAAARLREPIPDTTEPVDDFNRPDEQPLSDGGAWSLQSGYQLKVVSNQLACSASSTCRYWRNDVRYGPDQEAWATMETKPGHGNWFRLYVRLQLPTTFEGYALRYLNNPGTDQVFLERHQGGQVTTLATFDREIMMGDKLKIRAVGSTVEAWRRDNNTGSWTMLGQPAGDATFVGAGYVAVEVRYPYARLDDFGAATLREAMPDTSIPIDDFNRADEQPLSDGGKWSQLNGYQLKVTSNQLACSASSTCQSWRSDASYGPDQEAWATFATKPTDWVRLYVRLQMPGGFNGYALRYQPNASGVDQVYLEKVTGGNATVLGTAFNQEFLLDDKLRIRAVGSTIEAWRRDNGTGLWTKLGEVTDTTYPGGGYLGVGIRYPNTRLDDFGGGNAIPSLDPDALLSRYAPELRYDVLDTFQAGSAAMLTDNFQSTYSNTLIVPSVGFMAQADPDLPEDDLSLDYLGLFYPPGGIAQGRMSTEEDYIEEGDTYTADAERMQDDPLYADRMYARVVPEQDGGWTLQYWFFYYFNWHPIWPAGDHQGDWEMIQVQVDAFGIASRAVYAQHAVGEDCPWGLVETNSAGHPVVYVARGSHASFFRAGTKPVMVPELPGDYADGNYPPITPAIVRIDSPEPNWLGWAGHWGEGGPRGPQYQGAKWISPSYWGDSVSGCWEAFSARRSTDSRRLSAPPAPRIVATRIGKRVRVAYSFSVWPANPARRPVTLITSVLGSGRRDSPLVDRHRISTRKGTYYRPLGLGKPPYKLFAAAYSRQGLSSPTVTVRVRGG